jgi:hypothetical protein
VKNRPLSRRMPGAWPGPQHAPHVLRTTSHRRAPGPSRACGRGGASRPAAMPAHVGRRPAKLRAWPLLAASAGAASRRGPGTASWTRAPPPPHPASAPPPAPHTSGGHTGRSRARLNLPCAPCSAPGPGSVIPRVAGHHRRCSWISCALSNQQPALCSPSPARDAHTSQPPCVR